ncbi:uncharacterized protein LY89DRAFT_736734 [Mollisia scopiformis]|uniref:Uncharacterized protein n=1 Tax=Mollisia scopiformis TaxID=149040 RepID=A0A194X0K8_MOLSC|nr:uncharacterized protein LY89DRAFT_736734 [Mollisia scopiformis]KUJ13733.1 hypothetical protein LY89DRAFT_736734 [Mollisia scopiformis]
MGAPLSHKPRRYWQRTSSVERGRYPGRLVHSGDQKVLSTTRPRYGKVGLDLEVECDTNPTLQCINGPNEEPDILKAVKTMIGNGRGYILSFNTFATFSKEWARPGLIIETAGTASYHGMDLAVNFAAVIGFPGEHHEEKVTLLLRHGNLNVDSDLPNRLRYQWSCEENSNRPTDLS